MKNKNIFGNSGRKCIQDVRLATIGSSVLSSFTSCMTENGNPEKKLKIKVEGKSGIALVSE